LLAIIRAIEVSQTGNPDEIAMALIAHADARYDARQAPVSTAATPASTITSPARAQATAPQAHSVTSLTVEDAAMEARYFEALRVAFNSNVCLRIDVDRFPALP
jgi:hypothetical protein